MSREGYTVKGISNTISKRSAFRVVIAITGSGGRHYIFKYPMNRKIQNSVSFYQGLDVSSDRGVIVVAPGVHVSGNYFDEGKAKTIRIKW